MIVPLMMVVGALIFLFLMGGIGALLGALAGAAIVVPIAWALR